jgi:hypothetical protein
MIVSVSPAVEIRMQDGQPAATARTRIPIRLFGQAQV